jgi:asparagine synthase (glutamine-hydrolysing)
MCGIFSVLSKKSKLNINDILSSYETGKKRGPESSKINMINDNIIFGFHRLAINGVSDITSMQPFKINQCVLICNGEIYNWKQLYKSMNIVPNTGSDCEVIIHCYKKYGMTHTLQLLDGVFAFILYDKETKNIFIARDTYGIRPLFISNDDDKYLIASEMKSIINIPYRTNNIQQFTPGNCIKINLEKNIEQHFSFSHCNSFTNYNITNEKDALFAIKHSLINAVKKRVENTDREITCLLSGGLDSSLIASLVRKVTKNKPLHTWSIGLKGSEDLKYAEIVADYIGSIHHRIELEESEFLGAIKEVIYDIESYDTTTVRASVGNWLISKYIKENSNAKVVFNGDGSDEVTGGYMYFHCAPDELEFDKECRRLLNDIHYFDVLRSDRSISSHGLEARTPFLDRSFVQTYLSIPPEIRFHPKYKKCEKYLLRTAFKTMGLLPDEILFRTKEAFSDGVSKQTRSWFEIIQEHIVKNGGEKYSKMAPKEAEKQYYMDIFDSYYPGQRDVIPYLWMPKYVDADDASARTLDVYKKKI